MLPGFTAQASLREGDVSNPYRGLVQALRSTDLVVPAMNCRSRDGHSYCICNNMWCCRDKERCWCCEPVFGIPPKPGPDV